MVVWHKHSIQGQCNNHTGHESRVSAKPPWSPCTYGSVKGRRKCQHITRYISCHINYMNVHLGNTNTALSYYPRNAVIPKNGDPYSPVPFQHHLRPLDDLVVWAADAPLAGGVHPPRVDTEVVRAGDDELVVGAGEAAALHGAAVEVPVRVELGPLRMRNQHDYRISTGCPICSWTCVGLTLIWVCHPPCPAASAKFPSAQGKLGRQWNTQNQSQPNPGQVSRLLLHPTPGTRADGTPCFFTLSDN